MLATFTALADPNRLRILELLKERPRAVNELCKELRIAQPQVSKHLRTLRDAGFVEMEPKAQQRVYGLATEPLQAIDAWLDTYRVLWNGALDALEARVDVVATRERKTAKRVATRHAAKPSKKPPRRKR